MFVKGNLLAATSLDYTIKNVNPVAYWWTKTNDLRSTSCWSEMIQSTLSVAASMPSNSLWVEWGVATGKSTTMIRQVMNMIPDHADSLLHGFDSFRGLPRSWLKYQGGVFGMQGEPPEGVRDDPKIQLHIGWFNTTLKDLELLRAETPQLAFGHVDVDLFDSAWEVLNAVCPFLQPGTVLVFDEYFNYNNWEREGEFLAWELFSTRYQIQFEYLGIYFEQSVPMVITHMGIPGCVDG
mmetsp:Transcript_54511/g.125087  ORF Transcript_54511/g.125087 Transcript_54511/m.125087 type:complete len:237 (+) Transcript_54511:84-794(+)